MMAHDDSDLLRQALALLEAGNANAACVALNNLKNANPADPQAWHFLGICHNTLGNPIEAEKCLRTAIGNHSPSAYTYSNLGILLVKQDRFDEAIPLLERAIEIMPDLADAFVGLAFIHLQQGNSHKAESTCETAIRTDPNLSKAYYVMGLIHAARKDWGSAISSYDKALQINPADSDTHNNLAIAYEGLNEVDRAIATYKTAIQLDRGQYKAHTNLGAAYARKKMHEAATDEYRTAIAIKPDYATAHFNLGVVYSEQSKTDLAIGSYRTAICLNHSYLEAWVNLGAIYTNLMQLDESDSCYRHALEIDHRHQDANYGLAVNLQYQGKLTESVSRYRALLEIAPDHHMGWHNYLYILNFLPTADRSFLSNEHMRWGRRPNLNAGQSMPAKRTHPVPGKRLKIGYVSPDFRTHSVSYFLEPILANHDPEKVEIYCYAELQNTDAVTDRLKFFAHHWRTTKDKTDIDVANQISDDGIDILVDLAGHSSGNRLGVFSYRPAPIQVTYLGYPNTTGHPRIDYLLTDTWVDPQGSESCFIEKLVRLPESFCCYQPPSHSPTISPLPCTNQGYITFASLNNQIKLNNEVLSLWSRILGALPESRLILQAKEFSDGSTRSRFHERLIHNGIDVAKVQLLPSMSFQEHLAVYQDVDIALDTFPWCGHTTSCHALWMGVPVVTLTGDRHATRMASSIMHNVGLPELIADDQEKYIEIALQLAHDRPRLSKLRSTMRERMLSSTLCDGKTFTRNLEEAYQKMWTAVCQEQAGITKHS